MKWISVKSLQRDFGLSRIAGEAIVGEQTSLVVSHYDWKSIAIIGMYLCGLLWGLGELDWLLSSQPDRWQQLLHLPGWALIVFSWFVLPRLFAGDAILAAAAQASEALTGAST